MSFFFHSLVRTFLAERAIHLVSNEIRDELHARNTEPTHFRQVDFALLFSGKPELNAFLDLCGRTSVTQGNGITFHQTMINEKSAVLVDVSSDPVKTTEAILNVFQPKRVISAGFAKSLQKNMKNRLFIPTKIVATKSASSLEIWNPSLIEGPQASGEKNDICSGILCSGRPSHAILEKYDLFAVDSSTYYVVNTCRERNIPCFPLEVITSNYDSRNDVSQKCSFARKFGHFLGKTWKSPKYALNSFHHQINLLETGEVLAKIVVKFFF